MINSDLAKKEDGKAFWPDVKFCIAKDKTFFGPGTQQLFLLIKITGSVRLACLEMGMSYSKGWRIIAIIEQELGCKVVSRKQGGKYGGETKLTMQGEELLHLYEEFENESRKAVCIIFNKYFDT